MNRPLKQIALLSLAVLTVLAVSPLGRTQNAKPSNPAPQSSAGHDNMGSMPGMDMGEAKADPDATASADHAMSEHHMNMAHMHMTDLRPANANDEKRAAEIVSTLRSSIDKYKDYRVALGDGFQIFLPNVPQDHYHFTNYRYALEASFTFNPSHPTSLLYKKTADGYELEGAMYTAPRRFTEEQLNERVPLSVARWHQHVNFCLPPRGELKNVGISHPFGFWGSITTESACQDAGGRWFPVIFGWMAHVYPYETAADEIWAH
jgi:hypothetical protein